MNIPKITLNNHSQIPVVGNGPGIFQSSAIHQADDNKAIAFVQKAYNKLYDRKRRERLYIDAVINSLRLGFLLDFSAAYGHEELIGQAIKESQIDRKDLFLTTRVSNGQQLKGNIKTQLLRTLEKYQTEYVDLYMFHWPVTGVYPNTWKQMEELYREGYCKSIGVANCHQHHIEKLLASSEIVPAINQIEIHPLFTQKPLIKYCQSKGITVEAYTPIARFDDRLVRLPKLKAIADKHHKSIAQIILKWHIQNGVIPVVHSLNKKRQLENISLFDFELSPEEIKTIDSFNIHSRLRFDPDNCDFSIL